MIIKLKDGEDITDKFIKLIVILDRVRKYQRLWEQNYGVYAKARKKFWEAKADELMAELGSNPNDFTEKINIVYDTGV